MRLMVCDASNLHCARYCFYIIIKQVQQPVFNMAGNVFLYIKRKIYQHLSLTCLGQHLSKKAICKNKQSLYTLQCCEVKRDTSALMLKVPSKHANLLCHHPRLFTITSSTPAETLLRRSGPWNQSALR